VKKICGGDMTSPPAMRGAGGGGGGVGWGRAAARAIRPSRAARSPDNRPESPRIAPQRGAKGPKPMEISRLRGRVGVPRGRHEAARRPQIVANRDKLAGCWRPGCAQKRDSRPATGKTARKVIQDMASAARRPEIASNRVRASSTRRRGARSPPSIERRGFGAIYLR